MRAGTPHLTLAFRLGRPLPARVQDDQEPEPAAALADKPLALRPAMDLETRLTLRDLGWKP